MGASQVLRDAAGLRQEGPGLGMGWRALSGDARSLLPACIYPHHADSLLSLGCSSFRFHNLDGLEARSRWGLTATPPTNSAAEISFLVPGLPLVDSVVCKGATSVQYQPSQPQASFHRVFVPRDSDLEAQPWTESSF